MTGSFFRDWLLTWEVGSALAAFLAYYLAYYQFHWVFAAVWRVPLVNEFFRLPLRLAGETEAALGCAQFVCSPLFFAFAIGYGVAMATAVGLLLRAVRPA